jgi:hypothetical protein
MVSKGKGKPTTKSVPAPKVPPQSGPNPYGKPKGS